MTILTRRMFWLSAFGLFCAVPSASSCQKDHEQERLILTGSSTMAPLMLEIGKRFEEQMPGVRVDVQSGGSSRGVAGARSGAADIGMASRNLVDSERDLFARTIALDGIALIVHATNPVDQLSSDQVRAIYTGALTNWKQLGGRDEEIAVVNKAEGRSTLELFLSHFKLANSAVKASVVIGDNQQGIKTVAGNPSAIGYVSIGTAEFEASSGAPIRMLSMEGIPANVQRIQSGEFSLSRPLNLVTRESPRGVAEQFIEFAQSESVHDIVKDHYFVIPSVQTSAKGR